MNNNNNYNDPDAFIRVHNNKPNQEARSLRNAERARREKTIEEARQHQRKPWAPPTTTNDFTTTIPKNVQTKSINPKKRTAEGLKRQKQAKKTKQKIIAAVLCITLSTSTIAITIGAHFISNAIKYLHRINKANERKAVLKEIALQELIKTNLATAEKNNIKTNPTSAYNKLDISSNNQLAIYIYYTVLPTQEFQKLLNTLGYTDIRQYLRREGFTDNNGQPDYNIWENYMESKLENLPKNLLKQENLQELLKKYPELAEFLKNDPKIFYNPDTNEFSLISEDYMTTSIPTQGKTK